MDPRRVLTFRAVAHERSFSAAARALALAHRLRLAETQLAELTGAERTRLRIGAFSSSLAALVPEAVQRLRRAVPEAEVQVQEGDSQALAERDHDGLERHDVLREPFLAGLAPDHPLAGRATLRIDELAQDAWSAASTDGLIARACRAAGFEPRIVAITRDPIAIREFIVRG